MLKLGYPTNIYDVNNIELKVGDEILPIKFKDIPSIVVYCEDGQFYRMKKHFDTFYFNKLGNCKVKKVRSLPKNLFDVIINCVIQCQEIERQNENNVLDEDIPPTTKYFKK